MYTSLVLSQQSQNELIARFRDVIPPNWKVFAHHMTINMGNAADGPLAGSSFNVGDNASMQVVKYAYDNKVMAVAVTSDVPSTNAIKHITIAVDVNSGGKPFQSNQLTNWQVTSPFNLHGIIQELQ